MPVSPRRRRQRVTVVDRSMAPTLLPGDRLYVEPRSDIPADIAAGEIVVVVDPEVRERWLVKRVYRVLPASTAPLDPDRAFPMLEVRGDNAAESRDSRHFGPIPLSRVVGVVRERYWPADRRGILSPVDVP